MRAQAHADDPSAAEVLARGCLFPVRTVTGVWVRCGTRIKSRCPSCAELYRGDWAAIARSGVFDGPVEQYRFYLLTLTAPSFGGVHRVPRDSGRKPPRCGCGSTHTSGDSALRGVPLDPSSYDYAGQVAWNRDAGVLWDRTRRRMRDRWDSLEYFIVREWQDRGVLHIHAVVRIVRTEAPSPDALRDAARTATAFSKVDGASVEWGAQAKCDAFRADGDGAKTIWYLSKALNYVLKDVATDSGDVPVHVWRHQVALSDAARRMRCSPDCDPQDCGSLVHKRYGSRSQVVSASRRTKHRTGWSFTGLTRTVQRRLRREWWESRLRDEAAEDVPAVPPAPLEDLAARSRRELIARGWSAP
ncbi:replication initiator [Microbacterium sp.]|uniref:replication initiator n=1 Tax=Microbacterium sp. TaxID=51671 RepID=UPI00351D6D6B